MLHMHAALTGLLLRLDNFKRGMDFKGHYEVRSLTTDDCMVRAEDKNLEAIEHLLCSCLTQPCLKV